ncbi:chemotaxis protein CheB [Desulfatitalea alkaliphila]|uniref:PAS domain-containing protein n=1 Tax=Desulfatitalea alkaliphila TaxID=2929485 RepID=A0AA41UIQ6_9BACT|nr:chemotaxis protein CheB [Desulfatitalea alkaliphila]MCJ8500354.1 PAS domain-containing protein [Desulfatitalea alkaliphila]
MHRDTGKGERPPSFFVGIGASAGGLEALEAFFAHMPANSGMAFVVIQHLAPDYKSLMVELLSKRTAMAVRRAEQGMRVEPDTVYLIPPRKHLTIFHGKLILKEHDHGKGLNLPIDIFLHSLAQDQAEKAIAIILSGTGSDGVRGIRAIKEAGGMIMVQSEASAKFDGMPRAAVATGLADIVLPPEEMPARLLGFIRQPIADPAHRTPVLFSDADGLDRIFQLLREQTKVDFTLYKPSTVMRRIERRMTVTQAEDLNAYVRVLETRPIEVATLYRELLISVTSFFRDHSVFDALRTHYLPSLLRSVGNRELRFWVPGCATGEEAYTLAILVRESMAGLGDARNIKIFATDLDRDALLNAGNGVYPDSIGADLPAGLLTKYFVHREHTFQVQRQIREMVVFAQHNLAKDPPFTNIDLVSCRNLLIYLQPALQQKVMAFINFSLNPGGLLLLGTSETPGEAIELFETLDHKLKIYRSRGRKRPLAGVPFQVSAHTPLETTAVRFDSGRRVLSARQEERMQEHLLEALAADYGFALAVVNEHLDLLFLAGETDGLLRLPSGRVHNDITRMAVKELSIPLATGLQKVFGSGDEIRYTNIRLPSGAGVRTMQMRMRLLPAKKGHERIAVVAIESAASPQNELPANGTQAYDLSQEAEQRIHDLEQDLQFTKENLQATIEELETANEELQATNEELLASNEELQSTNEELQSVNEELHTVNAEYQSKILELTETTNDLDNLIAATNIATLFLDENLEIRKFTPALEKIYRITEADLGRPLFHLAHCLEGIEPLTTVQTVVGGNRMIEQECRTRDGDWFLMRVLPYAVGGGETSGIVLTFTDIGPLKQIQADLSMERSQLLSVFNSIDHIIYVADMDDYTVLFANETARKVYGERIEGGICHEVLQQRSEPCDFCTNVIIRANPGVPHRWEYRSPVTGADYDITDRVIHWPDGRSVRLELAVDITERKRMEMALCEVVESGEADSGNR